MPSLGLTRASMAAAALNVLAAGLAVALARRIGAPTAARPRPRHRRRSPPTAAADERTRRVVLIVFLLSGVFSLALEVIWFRVLILQLRPTAYAFAVMLAAVLCGISAGSYAVTPWLQRRRAVAGRAVGPAARHRARRRAVAESPGRGAGGCSPGLAPLLGVVGIDPYVWPLITTSLIAILPTSLLLGAAFPIGLRLWVSDPSKASEQVSVFYALNVCGAIVGPLRGGISPAAVARQPQRAHRRVGPGALQQHGAGVPAVEQLAERGRLPDTGRARGVRDGQPERRRSVRRGRAASGGRSGCCG